MIAKVEPLTSARALRGPFDYVLPEGLGVGSVLEVPFARRRVLGVVVEVAGEEYARLLVSMADADVIATHLATVVAST